jgi:ATP-binding cassette subfamily B protein
MLFGKYINGYYKKYFFVLLLGVLSLVLVDYFQLKIPEIYRMLINGINNGYVEKNGQNLPFNMDFVLDEICAPMLVILLVMVAGRFLWRVCFFGSALGVESDLRNRMFDKCRTLSVEYYAENKVGNIMSFFTNDLDTVQDCFGSGVLMFFDALLLGVLAIIKMVRMSLPLTLLSLLPMAILLAAGLVISKSMKQKWKERQEAFSELSDFAQERFSGMGVVKAFVKEFKTLLAFRWRNQKNEEVNVAYTKISTLLNVLVLLFVETVVCVILGFGGYLVYQGKFDAGQLVEFIGYFEAIVWPIEAVGSLIALQSQGKASLTRIEDLLDEEPTVADKKGAEECGVLQGEIEVKALDFAYPKSERKVLSELTFHIAAGENVGIIGRTGSGKTTIADLLVRAYNAADGTLFLDGKDINTLTVHSVRKNIAYVPQDNFLFGDTIANNIAFGLKEGGMPEIERAATLADVKDDVDLFPQKFQTVLGERGTRVSGGQKQRIAIARALVKDSPILILDDSLSAVDTDTERVILSNLRNTRKGKTTLVISHRISTVLNMDKIIYLQNGTAIAVGTHEELYENCLPYRETFDLQKLEDEQKEDESHA